MAKQLQKNSPNRRQSSSQSSAVVKERVVRNSGNEKNRDRLAGRKSKPSSSASQPGDKKPRRGFFDIYKPGQGHNTRLMSGVGFGVLVCWFAYFLYDKLSIVDIGQYTQVLQVGVAVAAIVVFGLLGYWLLGLNKKVGDFLIATEGEMKKVNWTSRKEIIGSTKVVIFLVVSMSILLFMVDFFFMAFFSYIGVLKGASLFDALKEIF